MIAEHEAMKPFKEFPFRLKSQIQYVLTDIDDTLTVHGRLPSSVFSAMEKLREKHIAIIPITGRPAGWCDHIARMWPVEGLVGENGAFYFYYDDPKKKMLRRYWKSEKQRQKDRRKLDLLKTEILKNVPAAQISADQPYREADLAIDFCEDVPRLSDEDIQKIVQLFQRAGAQAKISSIHVNGWFGDYDKLAMTKLLFKERFEIDLDVSRDRVLFVGDSPNDCPMFAFFTHSVGVANIREFELALTSKPVWITQKHGGFGFAELVEILLA